MADDNSFKLFSARKHQKIIAPPTPVKEEEEEEAIQELEPEFIEDDTTKTTFASIGLDACLIQSLSQLSITTPTPIQLACIPPTLAGRNVCASAKTGSGKTAAFALPMLQMLSRDKYGVFGLVLTPTRELAYQIGEQFKVMGESVGLRLSVIVGGVDMMRQTLELQRRPHIVVATPGRLADHLQSSPDAVYLKRLQFLVLDEADRMLDETFSKALDTILSHLPAKRQTLLFSATMTPEIEQLATPTTFVFRTLDNLDKTVAKLDQRYLITPSLVRDAYLVHLLQTIYAGQTAIIFTAKCKTCELLRVMLRHLEIDTTALHSQMTQDNRLSSLARFRTGLVKILIITDVGSRGLDIPTVQVVVNYDTPPCATDYIHRVGRTARAGRGGRAISLVTEYDVNLILNIEEKIGKKMEMEVVSDNAVNEILTKVAEAKREASMFLSDTDFGAKRRANRLKHGHDNSKLYTRRKVKNESEAK